MEWEAPAIILRSELQGETSLIVTVFTQTHGVSRGMVKGGNSSRHRSIWQVGNIIMVRWKARLAEQLGNFTAEPVKIIAARLLDFPLSLALMTSSCALLVSTLPDKEPYPDLFNHLVRLFNAMAVFPNEPPFADYIRWEVLLLEQLGYGLDLTQCTVTGRKTDLKFLSPRTGKAVSEEGAGEWKSRLFILPSFLLNDHESGTLEQWKQGLLITTHFLEKAVFGSFHRDLPAARKRLLEKLS
ncbi:DNA repair protein RecO [Aristophania vespae]|uniref:DNA repair protein RecO n=1 Tax=Aristophania vespae TaxID=2697033 RepID=A0A6P1NIE6_9PROT|nr:DNA repair protein RecO [Aristophania vespae]QHI95432.1 DNA repair protein RecO [Aristophania vespae]